MVLQQGYLSVGQGILIYELHAPLVWATCALPYLLRHQNASLSIVPAGCLWPQAGVRPVRREHLLPIQTTLRTIFTTLGRLKPLGKTSGARTHAV